VRRGWWPKRGEGGFSLVELLVVMVVIGVLAAIAVPLYAAQRQQGYDATAKSDLRVWAEREDGLLITINRYGTLAELDADGTPLLVSPGVTATVVRYSGATGYCLSAKHSQSTNTWFWDSRAGGLQPLGAAGCPVVTVGSSGGSRTG
jgi:type IV pilus assembly protein PilA